MIKKTEKTKEIPQSLKRDNSTSCNPGKKTCQSLKFLLICIHQMQLSHQEDLATVPPGVLLKNAVHTSLSCAKCSFSLSSWTDTHTCMHQSVLLAFSALFCSTENDTVFMFPGRCCCGSVATTEPFSAARHGAPRPSDGLGPASTEGGSK